MVLRFLYGRVRGIPNGLSFTKLIFGTHIREKKRNVEVMMVLDEC